MIMTIESTRHTFGRWCDVTSGQALAGMSIIRLVTPFLCHIPTHSLSMMMVVEFLL